MNISEQEEYDRLQLCLSDALALLGEASAYLKRLPPVVPTRELFTRIDKHLENPVNIHTVREAKERGHALRSVQVGSIFAPHGVEVLRVEVEKQEARVYLANGGDENGLKDEDVRKVIASLQREGMALSLTEPEAKSRFSLGTS